MGLPKTTSSPGGLRTSRLLIPTALIPILLTISGGLTVVAMAALGLSVNMRTVASKGRRVLFAASASLLSLTTMSYCCVVLVLAK